MKQNFIGWGFKNWALDHFVAAIVSNHSVDRSCLRWARWYMYTRHTWWSLMQPASSSVVSNPVSSFIIFTMFLIVLKLNTFKKNQINLLPVIVQQLKRIVLFSFFWSAEFGFEYQCCKCHFNINTPWCLHKFLHKHDVIIKGFQSFSSGRVQGLIKIIRCHHDAHTLKRISVQGVRVSAEKVV